MNPSFWKDRKVFLTGHTGFKGSWLSLWLQEMGAEVWGYSLTPQCQPNLFEIADVAGKMHSTLGDIQDAEHLRAALHKSQASIVIHLAAQALVRRSYREPVETYATNVMGTVHLLEAVRSLPSVEVALMVTSDKCYKNEEWEWGYRESDRLGGDDPYSNSKACAELVTESYRRSFFSEKSGTVVATARAGNVLGGGDWAEDRLIPDVVRAWSTGRTIEIRNPRSVRPWQHVLEPLSGYLASIEKLSEFGHSFPHAFNFGPDLAQVRSVEDVLKNIQRAWPERALEIRFHAEPQGQMHETRFLALDSTRAKQSLGWTPRWNLDRTIHEVVHWYRSYLEKPESARETTLSQIRAYNV